MKYFQISLIGIGAVWADGHNDPCECIGPQDLPTEYFVEMGYQETYGTRCAAWDAKEAYCKDGGEYEGADWCAESYSWCYVSIECQSGIDTVFFAATEYEDKLSYATTPCDDPCQCVGAENLPTDYFVEKGYSN